MKKKGIAGKPVVLFLFYAKAQRGNTKGAKKQDDFLRLCEIFATLRETSSP